MTLSDEDKALFEAAMRGVKPLNRPALTPVAPTKPAFRVQKNDVHEPLMLFLSDEIIDAVDPETILSFGLSALDASQTKALQKGQLRPTHILDLHGLTTDEAKTALLYFLEKALQQKARNILIIHGKGSRHGEAPILKNRVNRWLKQLPYVLAFHSACPKDGGAGAVYVRLKKVFKG